MTHTPSLSKQPYPLDVIGRSIFSTFAFFSRITILQMGSARLKESMYSICLLLYIHWASAATAMLNWGIFSHRSGGRAGDDAALTVRRRDVNAGR